MRQAVIVADSTADIPQSIASELGIHIVPMRLAFGDQSFVEGVDITAEEFYAKLTKSRELPTTSQTSPSQYAEVYRGLLGAHPGAPIISIHISSGMSGTYQSARLAKEMIEEELGQESGITVIDSLCASYGFGLQVVHAARLGGARGDGGTNSRRSGAFGPGTPALFSRRYAGLFAKRRPDRQSGGDFGKFAQYQADFVGGPGRRDLCRR
ncbi:hypothetical protein HMSSN036_10330 [Paenibacillus macerans]|nr:hypothetical protein HMSSN036_10330 [Paenibacillus macerans]